MHTSFSDPSTPWDAYNASNDFLNPLAAHGYQIASERNGKTNLTPPGGTKKQRGQIVFDQTRRALFAFTDNPHFERGKGYDPTGVYAALEHHGDRSEACRRLLELGYGERRQGASDGRGSRFGARATEADIPPAEHASAAGSRPKLSEEHRKHLLACAVAAQQIADRGYESVTDPARLRAVGFSWEQSENVPGLLIPYRNPAGEQFYQYRPDHPRQGKNKYEGLPGKPGRYGLDVPQACREQMQDVSIPLWLTEGAKKADAGAGAGLCIGSLPGVWMFRRENEAGRKVMLADFDAIPLRGRVVVICYDSDAMHKASVYAALRLLANGLRGRGAVVQFCYLPNDGEDKTGLDDYLVNNSVESLHALIKADLEPIVTAPAQSLLDALNRLNAGRAMFRAQGVDLTGCRSDAEKLNVMASMVNLRGQVEDTYRLWMGDAYNDLTMPEGEKIKAVKEAIGEALMYQVRKWAVVAKAFSGEREVWRACVPYWFLAEITALCEADQDACLEKYLQCEADANDAPTKEEAKEMRLTRDKLRAEIADKLPTRKPPRLTWSHLGKFLPDDVLELMMHSVETRGAREVAAFLRESLARWEAEQAEEEEAFRERCEGAHLFRTENGTKTESVEKPFHSYKKQKEQNSESALAAQTTQTAEHVPPAEHANELDTPPDAAPEPQLKELTPAATRPAILDRPAATAEHTPRKLTRVADVIAGDADLAALAAVTRAHVQETQPPPTPPQPKPRTGVRSEPLTPSAAPNPAPPDNREPSQAHGTGEDLEPLRAQFRAAWKAARLCYTPPVLASALGRTVEAAEDINPTLRVCTPADLRVLIAYAQTAQDALHKHSGVYPVVCWGEQHRQDVRLSVRIPAQQIAANAATLRNPAASEYARELAAQGLQAAQRHYDAGCYAPATLVTATDDDAGRY